MKLLKHMRELKIHRREYIIKPSIKFRVDKNYYIMSLLPTIMIEPWILRTPGDPIIDVSFLNMHLLIGTWNLRTDN